MSTDLCGTRKYPNIDEAKKNIIIQRLRENGATVTGNNPWDADTHKHGVKLRGHLQSETLSVTVTAKNKYVFCKKIWSELDKNIPKLQVLPVEAAESIVFNFHEEQEEAV